MRNFTKFILFEYEGESYAVDFRYNWFKGIYDVKVWVSKDDSPEWSNVKLEQYYRGIIWRIAWYYRHLSSWLKNKLFPSRFQ